MQRLTLLWRLLVVAAFVGARPLFAQQGSLEGRITNEAGAPISSARLEVLGTPSATLSNADGRYRILLSPGIYDLAFTSVGHRAVLVDSVTVSAVQTTTLDIVLLTAEALDPVAVTLPRAMLQSPHFDLLEPNYFITGATSSESLDAVKFHVAIRYRIVGFDRYTNTGLHFGYVQKSIGNLWNANGSRPVLESNYNPKVFLYLDGRTWPTAPWGDYLSFRLGWDHESNGRDGPGSRTWDRGTLTIEGGDPARSELYWAASTWHVWSVDSANNPDIIDTNGRGELRVFLQPWRGSRGWALQTAGVSVTTRVTPQRIASWEVALYARPWGQISSFAPSLMVQFFSGTGEYLMRHDWDHSVLRVGIALVE